MRKINDLFSIIFLPVLLLTSLNINLNSLRSNETKYQNIYILGDSLSDTGAFVGAGTDFVEHEWLTPWIKKISLDAPYYQNRSFSNGEVYTELVAKKLNLGLTPAWKFNVALSSKTFEQYGNNYAVGGAVAADNNSWAGYFYSNHFSIDKQLEAMLWQHQTLKGDDLVVLEAGNNDMIAAIDTGDFLKGMVIVRNAIDTQLSVVKKLIDKGIKHIVVSNLPDFSLVPKYNGTKEAELAKKLSNDYDIMWDQAVQNYQSIYPNIIKEHSLKNSFMKYQKEFKDQGKNTTQNAIESNKESLIINGTFSTKYVNGATPETINNYFFFDDVHPTQLVHEYVANDIYDLVKNW